MLNEFEQMQQYVERINSSLETAHHSCSADELIKGLEGALSGTELLMMSVRSRLNEVYSSCDWVQRYIPMSEGDPVVTGRIRIEDLEDTVGYRAVKLTLPLLLPNRRNKGMVSRFNESIGNSLYRVLSEFCHKTGFEPFCPAAVIFVSIHKDKRLLADQDNKELSSVMNALNLKLIWDDGAMDCALLLYDFRGDDDHTEVWVTDRENHVRLIQYIMGRNDQNV